MESDEDGEARVDGNPVEALVHLVLLEQRSHDHIPRARVLAAGAESLLEENERRATPPHDVVDVGSAHREGCDCIECTEMGPPDEGCLGARTGVLPAQRRRSAFESGEGQRDEVPS